MELEEPNFALDLVVRLLIIAVILGVLLVVTTQAYGSVEDTSGPATAPTTVTRSTDPTVPQTEPILSTSTPATVNGEGLPTARLAELSPEEVEAIEAEEAVETGPATPTSVLAEEEPPPAGAPADSSAPTTASAPTTTQGASTESTVTEVGATEPTSSAPTTVPATEPASEAEAEDTVPIESEDAADSEAAP